MGNVMSENTPAARLLTRRWLKTPNAQALIIAAIFAMSVLTFYVLFNAASKIEYFKEILAALIGTLLTAVITTLLLKSQTSNEESREKNVELFKRKFDQYSAFLELASRHTADRSLSKEESIQLLTTFHKIRLLGGKETAEELLAFIEDNFLEKGAPSFTVDRIAVVLKNDLLSLNESTEDNDLIDTSSFVTIINTDPEMRDRYQQVAQEVLDKIVCSLQEVDRFALKTCFKPTVWSDHVELSFITMNDLTYNVLVINEYIDSPDYLPIFSGTIEIGSGMDKQHVIDVAKSIGFSYDDGKDTISYAVDIKTRRKVHIREGDTIWSVRHFCACVVDLERKIGQSTSRAAS